MFEISNTQCILVEKFGFCLGLWCNSIGGGHVEKLMSDVSSIHHTCQNIYLICQSSTKVQVTHMEPSQL